MKWVSALALVMVLAAPASAFMSDSEIAAFQRETAGLPVGERIALWAEKFVGTPYDPDPLGEYVTRRAIVADDRVDCMYLTFRAVELALGGSPLGAEEEALEKRFITRGVVEGGKVLNYEDRFQYASDMIASGKWGREITASLPGSTEMEGSRGYEKVPVVPASQAARSAALLKSGDVVYFVKDPARRVADEIIGHIGIIKREGGSVYLIHASGRKKHGGKVRKELFADYLSSMPFAGIRVSRF